MADICLIIGSYSLFYILFLGFGLNNVVIFAIQDCYSSVALAEGRVKSDPECTGKCIQVFLKKDQTDNRYMRHRIKRFEFFNSEAQAGNKNQVAFNAANLSSGTYFSRVEYDGKVLMKKLLLIKLKSPY